MPFDSKNASDAKIGFHFRSSVAEIFHFSSHLTEVPVPLEKKYWGVEYFNTIMNDGLK